MTETLIEIPLPANIKERSKKRGRRSLAELREARGAIPLRYGKGNSENLEATSLGGRVRIARKRLGLSQQELAGPKYVASYISAIERDKIQPSLKALELIAKRLGEPVEFFLYGGYSSGAFGSESEVKEEDTLQPLGGRENSFNTAMRDKLLAAQIILEKASNLPGPAGKEERAAANEKLVSVPRHQLAEYDRAQLGYLFGRLYFQEQEPGLAFSELEEALVLAVKTSQISLEVEIRCLLGDLYLTSQQADKALIFHENCREIIESKPKLFPAEIKLAVLTSFIQDQLALNHPRLALEAFQEALQVEEEAGKLEAQANYFTGLAFYYQEKGNQVKARNFNQLSLYTYNRFNRRRDLVRLSQNAGEVLVCLGQTQEAEKILTRALNLGQAEKTLSGKNLALTYISLGSLRLQQSQYEEARQISSQAIEEANEAGDLAVQGRALHLAAEVETKLEQPEAARKYFQKAIELLEKSNQPRLLGNLYKAYGEALEKWGDYPTAVGYLKKAYESKS